MNNCTVIIAIITLIGLLFVPIISAGITIKGSSELFPGIESASSSYQYIKIDTGFPKIIPFNYSQPGYTPLIPNLYSYDTQKDSTSIYHVTIDTGLAPLSPVSLLQPEPRLQIPDTNPAICYPETQSVNGLTNSVGLKGFLSSY
jgi:hypothetical protein